MPSGLNVARLMQLDTRNARGEIRGSEFSRLTAGEGRVVVSDMIRKYVAKTYKLRRITFIVQREFNSRQISRPLAARAALRKMTNKYIFIIYLLEFIVSLSGCDWFFYLPYHSRPRLKHSRAGCRGNPNFVNT